MNNHASTATATGAPAPTSACAGTPTVIGPTKENDVWIVLDGDKPDSLGRQGFSIYWYDPLGEYGPSKTRNRGQCFFAPVSEYVEEGRKKGKNVTVMSSQEYAALRQRRVRADATGGGAGAGG